MHEVGETSEHHWGFYLFGRGGRLASRGAVNRTSRSEAVEFLFLGEDRLGRTRGVQSTEQGARIQEQAEDDRRDGEPRHPAHDRRAPQSSAEDEETETAGRNQRANPAATRLQGIAVALEREREGRGDGGEHEGECDSVAARKVGEEGD